MFSGSNRYRYSDANPHSDCSTSVLEISEVSEMDVTHAD